MSDLRSRLAALEAAAGIPARSSRLDWSDPLVAAGAVDVRPLPPDDAEVVDLAAARERRGR